MKMKPTYKYVLSAGGLGTPPPRQKHAARVPFRSLGGRLTTAGDNVIRATPCERKTEGQRFSGIKFAAVARTMGREVGLANPRADADTLGSKCQVAYVQWVNSTGVQDKHRPHNIRLATESALAAQKELTESLAVSDPLNKKHLRFREAEGGCSYKNRYSLLDEVNLPHLRYISSKRANSDKWERRKVVIWDHVGTLRPAVLIQCAESAGVDVSAWLKVRKVNGSGSEGRANRVEIFCQSELVRGDVMESVRSLLGGVIEDECVRLGRTFRFRREMRAKRIPEGEKSVELSNTFEVLRDLPQEGGSALDVPPTTPEHNSQVLQQENIRSEGLDTQLPGSDIQSSRVDRSRGGAQA